MKNEMSYFLTIPNETMCSIYADMYDDIKEWVYIYYGERCNQIKLAHYFLRLWVERGLEEAIEFSKMLEDKYNIGLEEYFTPYMVDMAIRDWLSDDVFEEM